MAPWALFGRPGAAAPASLVRDRVLLGLLALLIPPAAWAVARGGDVHGQLLMFWAISAVYDVCFLLLTRRVLRRGAAPATTRRFWRVMALAGGIFAVLDSSQLLLSYLDPHRTLEANGGVQTALMLVAVGSLVWVMLTHPLGISGRGRVRLWLDAATVMTSAAAVLWYSSVSGGGEGTADLVSTLLTSALVLVSMFAIVKLALGAAGPFTRGAGVSGSLAAALLCAGTALTPSLAHSPYLVLLLLLRTLPSLFWSASPRIQELQMLAAPGDVGGGPKRPYSRLPYAAVAVVMGLLVFSVARATPDLRLGGAVVAVVAVVALVVVRQLAAFADNAELLARLDTSMLELGGQEQRFRSLVQHSSDVTILTDATGRISYTSPALQHVLGRTAEQAQGRSCLAFLHREDRAALLSQFRRLASDEEVVADSDADDGFTVQARVRHRAGSWRWLEVTCSNKLHDPFVGAIIINARDVTEARHLQDRLRYQASHDPLTQLPNRDLFAQRMQLAAHPGGDEPDHVSLLVIDLDGFKLVNDTLGHHVGDLLLAAVADRLHACARSSDTVARLGGDEFALLLPGTPPDRAAALVRRIEASFDEPVLIEGHVLRIRASIGVASGPSQQAERLVRTADAAMYASKERHRTDALTTHSLR